MLVKEERKAKKANKSGRNARKKERQAEVGEDYSDTDMRETNIDEGEK